MSEYIEQVMNHDIHDIIRTAISPAEEIKASSDELNANIIEKVDRILYVLSELQRSIASVDPLLIPYETLNKLRSPVTNISNHLSSYQNNRNEAHIQNAYNQLDNVLIYLGQIRIPITSDDINSIRDAAVSLRRSAGQHLRNLERDGSAALQKVNELEDNLNRLKGLVEAENTRVTHALGMYSEKYQAAAEVQQSKNERIMHEFEHQSNKLLTNKDEEWNQVIEESKEKCEMHFKAINKKLLSIETELRKTASGIIDKMEEYKGDAEKIIGIITDTGMVGGYQRVANSERKAALFWRIVAFTSLVLLVAFAIAFFKVTLNDGFQISTSLTITRGFVAVAVGILSGYAARQAEKHERAQRKHRKMELELAAIAPYLYEFPSEEARKIKTELAMKLFAQQEIPTTKESKKTTNSVLDLLEMALDSIKALISKSGD